MIALAPESGGDVLKGFAFVLVVGIIGGTYSSIYVASPFALLWESLFGVNGKWRKASPARCLPVSTAPRSPAPVPRPPTATLRTAGRGRPGAGPDSAFSFHA